MVPVAIRLERCPDLLSLHQASPRQWPFLLASTATGGPLGRWSMLLVADGEPLQLDGAGRLSGPGEGSRFLQRLKTWTGFPSASAPPAEGLPFACGWFVYLGYELAGEIEPGLSLPAASDGLPVAFAQRCPAAIVIDHRLGEAWISAESQSVAEALRQQVDNFKSHWQAADCHLAPPEAEPGQRFKTGVERIRQYILDGDVFQVNLSRSWAAPGQESVTAADVFAALAGANPAPFAGLARLPGGTVISSSPERLVEIDGDCVQTRPIAGTRPRGQSQEIDQALSRELIANLKERAEHIMLIDLERNDLGRVCRPGSVEVDELMVIESYAHVHHIVSNVRGQLRPGIHATDVLAAVFPGGTITGCPKVRCMEIIAELEGTGRSFYTGSMGYLGNDGRLDMNILIRTLMLDDKALSFRTGAGIVADSRPDAELKETEAKAAGLLKAFRQ
ncbi:MAG: aminodeoxychorismate synthase component I [Wenzhouxiangella sp.]